MKSRSPRPKPGNETVSVQTESRSTSNTFPQHKSRILVVEDNPFFRGAVVGLINHQPDLVCCCQTDSVVATPAAVAEQKPNLILMDLELEDGESFDLIGVLKCRHPQIPILILSQRDETADAARALRAGANGYIAKLDAAIELLNGIRAVLHGKVYVSREVSGRLLQEILHEAKPIPAAGMIGTATSTGKHRKGGFS